MANNSIFMLVLLAFSLGAMQLDNPPEYKNYENIDELPHYCVHLVKKLSQQPETIDQNNRRAKILPVDNYHDCRIIEFLNMETKDIVGCDNTWPISAHLHVGRGATVCRQEIKLASGFNRPCSLQALLEAYQLTIETVKNGWTQASLSDYPEIPDRKNEDEWFLFVRSHPNILYMPGFITNFAQQVNLACKVACNSVVYARENWSRATVFLWVKKDAFDQVQAALKLNFSS